MYRAIVFVRTSTDVQEMESQRVSTINFCREDGYAEDEIKVIGTNGASAIKLDKLYLQDIDEMYRTIENNPIEGIYLFALDRLGRNEPILVTLKQYCIDNKIHLKIKDLNISLLNADKTVNDGTNILFSVLAAQAASEMRIKKARFNRARVRNYEAGKYMGGYIPFGYYIDEKGYYKVHEDEAAIIRLVYTLFNSRGFSAEKLAREMNERGYRNGKGRLFNPQYIRFILKASLYSGEDKDKSGRIMKYPPIVSREEQELARTILKENNTSIDKAQRNFFFGNKLIVCPVCGHHYLRKSGVYTCCGRQLSKREGQAHIANCDNKLSIAVNCMDGILWDLTKKELIADLESDRNETEKATREKITVTQQKIDTLNEKLQTYEDKIEEIYLEGDRKMLPEKLIDKRIAVVKKQQEDDNKRMVQLNEEMARYNQILENSDRKNKFLTSYNSITDVELNGDEKEMSDLIHSYVHKVTIGKTIYLDKPTYLLITVEMKNGKIYQVYFNGRQKKGARAYITDNEYFSDAVYDFQNIERTNDGITSKAIEDVKNLLSFCREYITNHSFTELWDELLGETEIHPLFERCYKNNIHQISHLINKLAIEKGE